MDDTAGSQWAELGRAMSLGSAARPRHKLGLDPSSARWSGLGSARCSGLSSGRLWKEEQ